MYSSAHRGQRSDSPNSLKLELQVILSDIEAGIQLASSRRAVCTLDHRANSLGQIACGYGNFVMYHLSL